MQFFAIFLALALAAAGAFAQPAKRADGKQGQMQQDERDRGRQQMRDFSRERQGRPDRPRQMTPEERAKLRKDVEEASRELRRK